MDHAPLNHDISKAPKSGTAYWTNADDDVRLRIAVWKPENVSRGTIFFLPGRGDYIELYGLPVTHFTDAGFTTLLIDWRGHGLSDRLVQNPKVGHVVDFSDYQKDVAAMVKAASALDLPRPWYLVGHSMGACIGLRSLINGFEVSAAALSAPMLGIHMASYERLAAWPITWAMRAIGKGYVYVPGFNDKSYVFNNAFEGNTLTRSQKNYDHWIIQGIVAPDLHTGGPSMSWLYAALHETRALSKLPSPEIPCIAFCGDQEETVDVPAIADRMKRWPNGALQDVSNAKHELFLETLDVRHRVMSDIVSLFDAK